MHIKLQLLKGMAINVAQYENFIREEDALELMSEMIERIEDLNKKYLKEQIEKRKNAKARS